MITRRLWLKLRYPPEWHPLYRRVVLSRAEMIPWYFWVIGVIFFPLLVLPAVFFTATTYSLIWTINVSSAIGKEQNAGTYDLMCATPAGEFGTNWIICTGCIHRNFSFERLHSGGLWLIRIIIGLLLLSTFFDPFTTTNTNTYMTSFRENAVIYAVVGIALVIDHYQSVVMSNLIGMLVPTYVQDVVLLRLTAPGVMLFLQFALYLIIGLIGFAALPALLSLFNVVLHDNLLIALQLVLFALIREGAVLALWRLLLYQLRSSPAEARHALDWSATGWV